MKRLFTLLFCSVYAFVAYAFEYNGLYYRVTSSANMTVAVTSGKEEYKGHYTIPNEVYYEGKTYIVTAIGGSAFSGCSELSSVSFYSNTYVSSIGDYAFSGCNGMTSISIPANVTSIGNYAFSGCVSLSSVTIEDATTTLWFGSGAMKGSNYGLFADAKLLSFYWGRPLNYNTSNGRSPIANQVYLSNITIGPNVTTLTPYMFYGNLAITSIDLPKTVTSLGTHAFHGLGKLKSFTVPEQITEIGDYAFAGCMELSSFDIPLWVTSIGAGAFGECLDLKSIVIPTSVTSIGNFAFNGCLSLKSVTFEESEDVLSLGYNEAGAGSAYLGKGMFYDCPLESVFIGRPLSYKTNMQYGYSPFGNNESLTKAHFGNPLKTIQSYLFAGCKSLKTLQFNSKCEPTSIDSYAFWNCASLTETDIVYPESVQALGDGVFSYCTSLEGYTIPNHVKTVGNYVFRGCEKLKSVVVKPSVQSIGTGTFNGCTSMTGLVFEESEDVLSLGYNEAGAGSAYLGKGMFFDCPLESVFIGRPLSYKTNMQYGYSPFANNESLTKAHFGNPVTAIQSYLFYGCKSLSTFQYNSNCKPTAIESYAFAYCNRGLTSYDIPETVTNIGTGAFKDCEKLPNIVIKPAVLSIGSYAFNGCTSLTGVTFEECEEALSLGYNEAGAGSAYLGKGMFYDCPLESVFIGRPLSYKTNMQYGYSPFGNNESLTKAHFGNPLKTIQSYLFAGCKSLKTLQFNSKCEPTSIDSYAFWNCASLTETDIVYPESVQALGDGVFSYCTSLEGYTIPNHVKTVGNYVFRGCEKLKSVVVKPSVQSIGTGTFNGCTSMTGLVFEESEDVLSLGYNEAGAGSAYLGKGMFFDCPLESVFIGRPLSYKTNMQYGYSPFANNESLTKAHFGNPVTAIQSYLFYGCKSLSTFQYNSNCKPTAIESYAFAYCNRGLTSYDIPETVTNIGTGAFKDCEKLPNIVIKPAVLSIGSYAFNGCTSLTGVTFEECEEALSLGYNEAGAGSAYLGKGMFFDCPLESVFIGRSLSYKTNMQYGYSPFANSATLQTATMGKGATTISANLFYGNHKLKTVTISETVISIGSSAFLNCDIISDLLLPNSLETIGDYAFSGCSLLSGLIFHPALKSIGNYAFRGCTNFTNFAFEESEEVLSLGNGASEGEKVGLFKDCPLVSVFIGRDLSYKYSPFANIATLTKARFGNPVTRIPNYVFQGVAALEKVEFNENCKLDAVGKYAFAQCSGLPTPAFPSTVTAFEEGAFQDCTSFSDFAMPAGLTTVGAYTFQNCTGFTKFTAPSTLTSIGNYAFAGCTGITSLVIEDSEEALSLGYGATKGAAYGLFFDCPLESLYLGKTLNYTVNSNGNYGYSPFYKISTLNEITIGPKVTSLPYCVFFGTGISEIYIPSNVTSMHSSALNNCNQLKRVIILGSTPISTDSNNSLITNSAEGSKFYVFFPDNYKSTKPWNNYADRIEPIGQFNTDFSYTGKSQTFTFSSDFPITLSNLETEVESGTYTKRIDVSYVTNGYTCNDILIYTYSVGKSIVTVTAKDVERVYGDENPAFEIVLDGFADGEDATTLESAPVAVTDATQMSKVGVYNIVVSGAKAKNYDFNYKNGTLTITKAPLTITAKDYTIKQGEELPTFEVEYDGFKNNEISSVLIKQPNISTTATSSSAPGEYEITVSGAEAQNYEITYVAGKLTIEEPDFIPGDANSDGNVNVTDIVEIVNYILGHPSAKFNKTAADVNNDGVVNVTDIVSVVNIILSSNARELTNRAAATNNLKLSGGSIKLRNAENYTAAQFDIHLTDGSTVNYLSLNSASDHQMTWKMVDVNTCRVIVYSLSNAPFRTTKDELFSVTLSGNATISNELLVNVDGMVTGINEMQFDKPVDVYDLRGNKVRSNTTDLNGLQKGVYIVNGKKVIVK